MVRSKVALALLLIAGVASPALVLPVGDAAAKDKKEESTLDLESLQKELDRQQ